MVAACRARLAVLCTTVRPHPSNRKRPENTRTRSNQRSTVDMEMLSTPAMADFLEPSTLLGDPIETRWRVAHAMTCRSRSAGEGGPQFLQRQRWTVPRRA